jgi:hypothetical protein
MHLIILSHTHKNFSTLNNMFQRKEIEEKKGKRGEGRNLSNFVEM